MALALGPLAPNGAPRSAGVRAREPIWIIWSFSHARNNILRPLRINPKKCVSKDRRGGEEIRINRTDLTVDNQAARLPGWPYVECRRMVDFYPEVHDSTTLEIQNCLMMAWASASEANWWTFKHSSRNCPLTD